MVKRINLILFKTVTELWNCWVCTQQLLSKLKVIDAMFKAIHFQIVDHLEKEWSLDRASDLWWKQNHKVSAFLLRIQLLTVWNVRNTMHAVMHHCNLQISRVQSLPFLKLDPWWLKHTSCKVRRQNAYSKKAWLHVVLPVQCMSTDFFLELYSASQPREDFH